MNPYEPEKVSRANELYSEVLATDAQAVEMLKELRMRATEELGVKFSTELLYEKLTAACNPKNFTGEAYNKERLDLANQLYQSVLMNADNFIALEEIEVEAKELIEENEKKLQTLANPDGGDDDGSYFVIIFVFVSLLIAFVLYLFRQ